jgi:hypothetical protein
MGIIATFLLTLIVFLLIGMGTGQLRDRGVWRRLTEPMDRDQPTPT